MDRLVVHVVDVLEGAVLLHYEDCYPQGVDVPQFIGCQFIEAFDDGLHHVHPDAEGDDMCCRVVTNFFIFDILHK